MLWCNDSVQGEAKLRAVVPALRRAQPGPGCGKPGRGQHLIIQGPAPVSLRSHSLKPLGKCGQNGERNFESLWRVAADSVTAVDQSSGSPAGEVIYTDIKVFCGRKTAATS